MAGMNPLLHTQPDYQRSACGRREDTCRDNGYTFNINDSRKREHHGDGLRILRIHSRLWPVLSKLAIVLLLLSSGQSHAESNFAHRFDVVWNLVAERYWDLQQSAIDWDEAREQFRPQALAAADDAAFFAVLETMVEAIGDDHSMFVPPERVLEIREMYGDLPCLGVFSQHDFEPLPLAFAALGQAQRLGESFQDGRVYSEMLKGDIAYIQLPDLASTNITADLRQAVARLEHSRAIILDLRGNPGGRLIEMMQAAGVFTTGLLWRTVTRWSLPLPYPTLGLPLSDAPLVILVDAQVNSAAEGLAGGLQAVGRATVIGETTAGNVEALLPFCLRDSSQLWLASGVLAPLRGATWEGRGVEPDIMTAPENALETALSYLQRQR